MLKARSNKDNGEQKHMNIIKGPLDNSFGEVVFICFLSPIHFLTSFV